MPEFFETMMGRKYYEATMPSIAKSLAKISKELPNLVPPQAVAINETDLPILLHKLNELFTGSIWNDACPEDPDTEIEYEAIRHARDSVGEVITFIEKFVNAEDRVNNISTLERIILGEFFNGFPDQIKHVDDVLNNIESADVSVWPPYESWDKDDLANHIRNIISVVKDSGENNV